MFMFAFFLPDIMDNVIRDVMGESYALPLLQRQLSRPQLVMTLCTGLFSSFFPFLFWWAEHWFCILTTQSESASIRDEELQGLRQQHELLRKMLDQQKQVSAR